MAPKKKEESQQSRQGVRVDTVVPSHPSVDFCQFRIETGRTPRLGLSPSLSMPQKRPQIDSVPFKLYWELSPPSMPNAKFAYHPLLKINS